MYTIDDIKVELLNPDEVKNFIRNHGIFACECYQTPERFAEKVGMSCLKEGHTSGSRADMFKFRIYCPRFTADQIMRHSVGTAINCQSQRYVAMDDAFSLYVPPQVMHDDILHTLYKFYEDQCKSHYQLVRNEMNAQGIKGEKANDLMRTMLPIGVPCSLTMGFTIEALIHFMHKRLCVRADAPIREVAKQMRDVVLAVEPRYEELLVPQCKALLYCPEKHGCGAVEGKDDIAQLIELGKEFKKFYDTMGYDYDDDTLE